MRVLVLPSWYPEEGSLNGIFIQEQCQGLISEGVDVVVYDLQSKFIQSSFGKSLNFLFSIEKGVKVYRRRSLLLPKRISFFRKYWLNRLQKDFIHIQNKEGKFDIIHAHGFIAGIFAFYLSGKMNLPYIITEHNTCLMNGLPPHYSKTFLSQVFKNASIIISVSELLSNQIQKIIPGVKPIFIPNGIDKLLFTPKIKNENKKRFNFIIVGSLEFRKNQEAAIKGLKRCLENNPELSLHLSIVGKGPDLQKLQVLSRQSNIQSHIDFYPKASREDTTELIRYSDSLLSLSKLETFGITMIEGLACGLPIIASNTGIASEVINDNTGILLNIVDENSVSNAMNKVAQNFESYHPQEIADSVSNYDQRYVCRRVIKVYDEIV